MKATLIEMNRKKKKNSDEWKSWLAWKTNAFMKELTV